MRKLYSSLLVMLIAMLAGAKAYAADWTFTIDIDHPEAVVLSQDYYGSDPISPHIGATTIKS